MPIDDARHPGPRGQPQHQPISRADDWKPTRCLDRPRAASARGASAPWQAAGRRPSASRPAAAPAHPAAGRALDGPHRRPARRRAAARAWPDPDDRPIRLHPRPRRPPRDCPDPRAEGAATPSSNATSSWPSATGAGSSRSSSTPSPAPCRSRSSASSRAARAAPVADDRRHLLELPVGRLQLDRRDDRLGALGGHARVHDDGARPALDRSCSARRCSRSSTASSTRPRSWSCSILFFRSSTCRGELADRGGLHGPRLVQLRRHRHDGRDPAAPLRRARRADVLRAPVVPAARQRGLLLVDDPAALDAGPVAASPATYVLDGVRRGLIDGVPITELGSDIWPLRDHGRRPSSRSGIWAFGRAERYAKRTGKLKRVG